MGKILYVEDELGSNVSRLLKMFELYLSKEEHRKLEQLEDSDFGISGEEVKRILSDNSVLCVEYRFPDALKRVMEMGRGEEYDLCILDRNLSGKTALSDSTYMDEELQRIAPDLDPEFLANYRGLEGDLLLFLMALQGVDCTAKVFFLSAYRDEKIRSRFLLKQMFKLDTFLQSHFIEKEPTALKKFTKEVINDLPMAYISFKYHTLLDYANRLRNGVEHRDALSKALYFLERNKMLPGFEKSSLRKMMEAIWAQLDAWHYIYPHEYVIKGKTYNSGFDKGTGNYGGGLLGYLDYAYLHDRKSFPSCIVPSMAMVWKYVSEELHDSRKDAESDREFLLRSAIYAICELLRWLYEDLGGENPHPENLPNRMPKPDSLSTTPNR